MHDIQIGIPGTAIHNVVTKTQQRNVRDGTSHLKIDETGNNLVSSDMCTPFLQITALSLTHLPVDKNNRLLKMCFSSANITN